MREFQRITQEIVEEIDALSKSQIKFWWLETSIEILGIITCLFGDDKGWPDPRLVYVVDVTGVKRENNGICWLTWL